MSNILEHFNIVVVLFFVFYLVVSCLVYPDFCFCLGPFDHPFLKVHGELNRLCLESNEEQSHMTQEEKDMAYFEKRYQERVGCYGNLVPRSSYRFLILLDGSSIKKR